MLTRATQIYLTPEQHRALRKLADASGRSMTEIIRDLVEQHLMPDRPPPTDLSDLAGVAIAGRPTDVASERDQMLLEAVGDFR